jgi:hypothetical protein
VRGEDLAVQQDCDDFLLVAAIPPLRGRCSRGANPCRFGRDDREGSGRDNPRNPGTHNPPFAGNAKGRPRARWLLEDDACAEIGAGLGLDREILKAQVGSVEIDANGLAEDGFG